MTRASLVNRLYFLGPLALATMLAGCAHSSPFTRPGTWHENNAAMRNLAAEVAYPRDLKHGHADIIYSGSIAQQAIGKALKSGITGQAGASLSAATGASSGSGGGSMGGASTSLSTLSLAP